ncbi:hypothetical protein DF18_03450 [Streptomyces rimosus]|nr:hypothetical protein DF18_03450 [Streptomyces rimosus]
MTATYRESFGRIEVVTLPTWVPTPESWKMVPRVASSCGSSIAQPIASSMERPACTGTAIRFSRSMIMPTTRATTAPMPSPRMVSLPSWRIGSPPIESFLTTTAHSSATTGMASAGTNSLLPSFRALASRCSGVVVRGVPRPVNPKPASTIMTSTAAPSGSAGAFFSTTQLL